ncbi:unnamed protein product [Lathyrus sativus]|nr:unnamed protein product [Lathyrus sativus]
MRVYKYEIFYASCYAVAYNCFNYCSNTNFEPPKSYITQIDTPTQVGEPQLHTHFAAFTSLLYCRAIFSQQGSFWGMICFGFILTC